MQRRRLLLSIAGWPALATAAAPGAAPTALRFPADLGAHPETRTEWWYVTGSLQAGTRLWGFQVTFFRAATGLATATLNPQSQAQTSRFGASQLLKRELTPSAYKLWSARSGGGKPNAAARRGR